MPNPQIACPHCRGPVSLPPGMGGTTVACPHCRKPFQLPGGEASPAGFSDEPDFSDIPEGPKRRSPGRQRGTSPMLWLLIAAPFVGILIVSLFLFKGSGMRSSLDKARLRSMYNEITKGMTEEESVRRAEAIMKEVPGKLNKNVHEEEDSNNLMYEFEKGDVKIILFIGKVEQKLVQKKQEGL